MKKVSLASLIVAIVLILCSIVTTFMGFSYMNGARIVRHTASYGFVRASYYTTEPLGNCGLGMIIVGGFLFLGGLLCLILSANTFVPSEKKEKKEEKKSEPAEKEVEAPKAQECCCKKESAEQPAEQPEPGEPEMPEMEEASAADAVTPEESE